MLLTQQPLSLVDKPVFNGKFPTAGYANAAIQQLANRTQFLLQQQQDNSTDISELNNALRDTSTTLNNKLLIPKHLC